MKKMNTLVTFASAALFSFAALAQHVLPTSEAEVRKIDFENKKITLKHGEIKNLDMPGMTMVFAVKDTKLLDDLKAGDIVSFTADYVSGTFTVLSLKRIN